MEAKKSHNLPSANWRTRKAGWVIQPESESPRTRGAEDINNQAEAKGMRTRWYEKQGGATGLSPGVQRPKNQELQLCQSTQKRLHHRGQH